MLRPEEEEDEEGLYDDVGASLMPMKEPQHALKHAMTGREYDPETLVTGNFAGETEYIDLDRRLEVPQPAQLISAANHASNNSAASYQLIRDQKKD